MKNFEDKFFDTRCHKPKSNQVLARFSAVAEFIDGGEKRQVLELLGNENTAFSISSIMTKLCHATLMDSYRVPRMMAKDLLEGMTEEEVLAKPYEFELEMFYYTDPHDVPKDDPHWSIISTLNVATKIVNKDGEKISIDG